MTDEAQTTPPRVHSPDPDRPLNPYARVCSAWTGDAYEPDLGICAAVNDGGRCQCEKRDRQHAR